MTGVFPARVRSPYLPGPRHCYGCGHVHGGRAYGVCLERDDRGEECPCVRVHDKPLNSGALCRKAAKDFARLDPKLRARIEAAITDGDFAGRPDPQALDFLAGEFGVLRGVVWRVWKASEAKR